MHEALRMRIVRPDEKFVVAGKIHDILEHLFLGVAADPDVAREILVHRPLHLRRMPHVLVAIVDPLEPFADPSDHRLDRSRAQPRKTLEHAVDHHRGQRLATRSSSLTARAGSRSEICAAGKSRFLWLAHSSKAHVLYARQSASAKSTSSISPSHTIPRLG